ncbi:MAG: hypothetical protein LBD58_10010 [Treponema sp.]|jgi:uncharacterized radical SAM superfamily Fe-S cluster-containing enzyme|nr:hypothetical protein [Treponema sp.]
MSKAHRGKGLQELPNRGKAECPICKRVVKVLYEEKGENDGKLKVCKVCKAAIKHGKKKAAVS